MKTNKSFSKRIKVTRKGKLLARSPGQNHFNAKESRVKRLARKKTTAITMTNKTRNRFLSK